MVGKFQIYNADACKMIEHFEDTNRVFDHIITDPPYNISKDNNFDTLKSPRKGIDFGEWDRGEFDLFSWIPRYTQLLSQNGSVIIFCSYRFISHIIDILESSSCNMVVKDILVWQKSNPMPRNVNRRYVQDMEFAIWAVRKKSKWVFNKPNNKPYLRAYFSTPTVSGKEKLGHPTQKSINLMKQIVSIHTNPGELIVDPFMGSGTTGAAAIALNRDFIGVEREKSFFEISQQRLQNIKQTLL